MNFALFRRLEDRVGDLGQRTPVVVRQRRRRRPIPDQQSAVVFEPRAGLGTGEPAAKFRN
jgi:hypothetical protein